MTGGNNFLSLCFNVGGRSIMITLSRLEYSQICNLPLTGAVELILRKEKELPLEITREILQHIQSGNFLVRNERL